MASLRVSLARLGLALWALSGVPGLVAAQEAVAETGVPTILVIDQDRLFAESAFGIASYAREEAAAAKLEAENASIQAELVAEEQELTLLRKTLSVEDFSARADAFDQKVVQIRAAQDGKARELSRARENDAKAFFAAVAPVLGDILVDRGAEAILDKTMVVLSVAAVDITDEAIARVDLVLVAPAPAAP